MARDAFFMVVLESLMYLRKQSLDQRPMLCMRYFGYPIAAAVDAAPMRNEWEEMYIVCSATNNRPGRVEPPPPLQTLSYCTQAFCMRRKISVSCAHTTTLTSSHTATHVHTHTHIDTLTPIH